MRKLKILWIICFIGFILSCSTTKKNAIIQTKSTEQEDTTKTIEDNQNQFQYLFVEGLKQKMLGNPQEAIKFFSGCLEMDPNSAVAMFELANIHAANNDFTSASLLLEKAISISPDNKWYRLMLARVYQQTKKFDKAAQVYNELIKQEPAPVLLPEKNPPHREIHIPADKQQSSFMPLDQKHFRD